MKDLIWTLIIVWLVYRVVETLRSTQKKHRPIDLNSTTEKRKPNSKSPLRDEGEYVDFEELP